MSRFVLAYSRASVEPELIEVFDQIEEFLSLNFPSEITSANLLDADHWVNAKIKQHGLMVTVTDTNKTVWASGNSSTSPWVNYDGVSVYVPV